MDLDSEIIERLEVVVDLRDDASIPGFLSRVENHLESGISRMGNSSSGTSNSDVPAPAAFTLALDNAIRSRIRTAPNREASPVRSFESVVNDAIGSNCGGVAEWKVPQSGRNVLDELNRLINALGAVVPSVLITHSRDYILREATSYITEMKSKLETIELDNNEALNDLDVFVKIIEREARIRIQCRNKNHPTVRVMTALMQLDLEVLKASVSVENDFMIQKVKVKVKMGSSFYTDKQLRSALWSKLSLQIRNINVHLKTRVDSGDRKLAQNP